MRRRNLLTGLAGLPLLTGEGVFAPAVADPRRTRTLRFVPQSNLPTLDPMSSSQVVGNHGFAVCDTLYGLDARGEPRPQMAEGHVVLDDGLRWRITLRPELRFHDGSPVRARDCVASLRRWLRLNPFGRYLADALAEWRVVDDRTFEARLRRPFPLLATALAQTGSSIAFILPERLALTDPLTPIGEVVGSGPYRFVAGEFVSGSRVVYERFEGYVPQAEAPERGTGGKMAHFPRVEWQVLPDAATAKAALVAGEVDWWELPSPDYYADLAKDPRVALQVDDPAGKSSFMRLNHLQPPFDDVRLRRAVLSAVSQADYMQSVLGDGRDLWRECRSQFPCGSEYETEDREHRMGGGIEAARRMVAEAGYDGHKAIVLSPTDNPLLASYGEITVDVMRRIGIDAEPFVSDWASVVQRRGNRGPVEKGGWSALSSYGSASSLSLPGSNYLLRADEAGGWFGWWRNAEAEALLGKWLTATDAEGRVDAGRDLGRVAMADVATVPLGQWLGRTAFRANIRGILPGPYSYFWNVRMEG